MIKENPFDLTGKNAIVTGGSKGIGRSIAEHMAAAGANVVISSRKQDMCDEVSNNINKNGGKSAGIACNISHKDQIENLIAKSREHFGAIDIFVSNAAVNPYAGPLPEISDEQYHKIMDSNVLSNIWIGKMILPDMIDRGGGSFIIVSSVGSLYSHATIGAYTISKAADNALVRNLALEWGKHNIRVNALLPGLVKTDMARILWDSDIGRDRIKNRFPIARVGEPDDLGPAAVFLASTAGQWMTGQTLIVDGGASIAH